MDRIWRLAGRALNVSVVLVHYHTPALAEEAVAALQRDASGSGLVLECVLVDNGSTAAEREQLQSLACRYLQATGERGVAANVGYAGGVNLGVATTTGDVVVIMNPDVFVQPGCLSSLCAALDAGIDVAGPRFFLDRACRLLQPPADPRSRSQDLRTVLAQAGLGAATSRRAWRRHAHRFWRTTTNLPCAQLSGALLAFRRPLWDRLGPFDAGYPLYFEETDWLARLAQHSGHAALVPNATAVHLYAQSTLAEPRSNTWFSQSEARFRRRWYGAVHTALVEQLGRLLAGRRRRWQASNPTRSKPGATNAGDAAWLEVAVDRCGHPAAGFRLDAESRCLDDTLKDLTGASPGAGFFLRWVGQDGRDRAARRWDAQNRSESPIV